MGKIRISNSYFKPDLVQYYDIVTRTLKKSQKQKANKFIENDCIKEIGFGTFNVYPIKGYNKLVYTVNIIEMDCNCQYATTQKKMGKTQCSCSHIFAVIQYLRRNRNEANQI